MALGPPVGCAAAARKVLGFLVLAVSSSTSTRADASLLDLAMLLCRRTVTASQMKSGHLTRLCAGLRPDKAVLVGEDHRLDPISQAQLAEYPADMRLHGRLG